MVLQNKHCLHRDGNDIDVTFVIRLAMSFLSSGILDLYKNLIEREA